MKKGLDIDTSVKGYWLTAGAAAIIVALLGGIFLLISSDDGDEPRQPTAAREIDTAGKARGKILSPKSGDRVPRAFTVEGTLSGIARDGHVWVAVQAGNVLFPKEPEIPAGDQRFVQEVVESGSPPGGRFALVLLLVDTGGQTEIDAWLRRGRSGGGFAGLSSISGSSRLDVVRELTLR